MKPKALIGLQIVMWMVCISYVLIGAGVNVSGAFIEATAELYGVKVDQWSPRFLYILRPLGVFMLGLGALAAAAALRPLRHRLAIYVFAGIAAVRGLQRLIFQEEISELFGISESRNLANMTFFLTTAVVLVVLDQLAHRSPEADQTAAS